LGFGNRAGGSTSPQETSLQRSVLGTEGRRRHHSVCPAVNLSELAGWLAAKRLM